MMELNDRDSMATEDKDTDKSPNNFSKRGDSLVSAPEKEPTEAERIKMEEQ